MQDSLEVIVARIDERTKDIKGDVTELKTTCKGLEETVNNNSGRLTVIEAEIKNSNHNGLSKKQTVGIGGVTALIVSVIVGVIEYFRH
jgi:ribosomal protein L6P/L9E